MTNVERISAFSGERLLYGPQLWQAGGRLQLKMIDVAHRETCGDQCIYVRGVRPVWRYQAWWGQLWAGWQLLCKSAWPQKSGIITEWGEGSARGRRASRSSRELLLEPFDVRTISKLIEMWLMQARDEKKPRRRRSAPKRVCSNRQRALPALTCL